MRTARLVGLSPDGRSLIVATDNGEELAIPADDRLRAALRGDRPRLGQLEIEMDSSLTPRDIQTRIRSGATLEEVTRVAGIPMDRVERFAAPVLAEREHVAATAMSSSVRRRGETSGHRSLRITVTERLLGRGIDIDTVSWDAYRLEDGRWAVTADYRSGEAGRHASFFYDTQARFSVAGNDEARWLLGEQSSAKGPQPGRRRPTATPQEGDDTEPTLDLSDDLALVRATQEPDEPTGEAAEPTIAVRRLHSVADPPPTDDEPEPEAEVDGPEPEPTAEESPMQTLYGMLDAHTEDSVRVYAGLSDATAVPATETTAGWEPALVVNIPAEPSDLDHRDEDDEHGGRAAVRAESEPGPTGPQPIEPDGPQPDQQRPVEIPGDRPPTEIPAPTAPETVPDTEPGAPGTDALRRPAKRKRAAVPSWDEIMFGGPKRPG
jgi:hypothetical protein